MPRKIKDEFALPGQRYPIPPELDGLTLFYSSLWKQKKLKSRMATKWMLEHGMLPEGLARRLDFIGTDWDEEDIEDYVPKVRFIFFKSIVKLESVKKAPKIFSFKPRIAPKKFDFRPIVKINH